MLSMTSCKSVNFGSFENYFRKKSFNSVFKDPVDVVLSLAIEGKRLYIGMVRAAKESAKIFLISNVSFFDLSCFIFLVQRSSFLYAGRSLLVTRIKTLCNDALGEKKLVKFCYEF